MQVSLKCEKSKPNMTPKGTIPFTWFADCDEEPKCHECGNTIFQYDNCYFCFGCKKFFCWECSKDAFVCHKHIKGNKEHSDRVVKIRLQEVE